MLHISLTLTFFLWCSKDLIYLLHIFHLVDQPFFENLFFLESCDMQHICELLLINVCLDWLFKYHYCSSDWESVLLHHVWHYCGSIGWLRQRLRFVLEEWQDVAHLLLNWVFLIFRQHVWNFHYWEMDPLD